MCKPKTEGGLGVRILEESNMAGMFKLEWDRLKNRKQWANFLQARFLRGGMPLNYYKSSSVWVGISQAIPQLKMDVAWSVGSKSNRNLYTDDWTVNGAFLDRAPIPPNPQYTTKHMLGQYVFNGKIMLPGPVQLHLQNLGITYSKVVIPSEQLEDELIWTRNLDGKLCVKEAFEAYREKGIRRSCLGRYDSYIPPKISVCLWKIYTNSLPTEYNATYRDVDHGGFFNCKNELVLEDQDHLFMFCE